MIKIEIDVTAESSENLVKLAQYLMSVAGHEMVPAELPAKSHTPLVLHEIPQVPTHNFHTSPPLNPLVNKIEDLFSKVAPPPPVPSAPVTIPNPFAVTPPPPVSSAGRLLPTDVDSKGTVWDGTIHTKNKAKNKDGSWKLSRSNARLEIVKETGVTEMEENSSPEVEEDPFIAFMNLVGSLIGRKKLTRPVLMQAANAAGIKSIEEIPLKPEFIPAIKIELGKLGVL